MKFSKAQQNIVDKMKDGWVLVESTSIAFPGSYLRHDNCSTINVRYNTLEILRKAGVIKQKSYEFPTRIWILDRE